MIHHERSRASEPVPYDVTRADRAARVAGRTLHIHIAKARHPTELSIGDGIHRASARQRKFGPAGAPLHGSDEMEKRLFI